MQEKNPLEHLPNNDSHLELANNEDPGDDIPQIFELPTPDMPLDRTTTGMSEEDFHRHLSEINSRAELIDFEFAFRDPDDKHFVYHTTGENLKDHISQLEIDSEFAKAKARFPKDPNVPDHIPPSMLERDMQMEIHKAIDAVESKPETGVLKKELIWNTRSIKELSLILLESDGIDSPSQQHFSGADLVFLIQQVSKGEAYIEEITRELGLREQVYNLLIRDGHTPKSLEHEEEERTAVAVQTKTIAPVPVQPRHSIPLPPENLQPKPKGGFFKKLKGFFGGK
jgi:hypothetical protein